MQPRCAMHAPVVNLNPRRLLTCDGPSGESYGRVQEALAEGAIALGSDLRLMWPEGSFGGAYEPAALYKLILDGEVFTADANKGIRQTTRWPRELQFINKLLSNNNYMAHGGYNYVYKSSLSECDVVRFSKEELTNSSSNIWFDDPLDTGVAALELMTALLGASLGISLPVKEGCIFHNRLYMILPKAVFKSPGEFTEGDIYALYDRLGEMSTAMKMAHLDCKPGNIAFLSGRLFLTDFGDLYMGVRSALSSRVILYASVLSFAIHMTSARPEVKAAIWMVIERASTATDPQDRGIDTFKKQVELPDSRFLAYYFEKRAANYLTGYSMKPRSETLAAYIQNQFLQEHLSSKLSDAMKLPIVCHAILEPEEDL